MSDVISITSINGQDIRGIYNRPRETLTAEIEYSLVIMAHGFPGNKSGPEDVFSSIEPMLHEKGLHTLRFDFRGCGESDGDPKNFTLQSAIDDFAAISNWANEQGYKRSIYISEGFGSIVTMMKNDIHVICHAMLWPALNPPPLAKQYANDDRMNPTFLKELETLSLKSAMRDITMPVMIIQGSEDRLFPMEHLDQARKYMSSKRLEISTFHGGEHGLAEPNYRKAMLQHIEQFLASYI